MQWAVYVMHEQELFVSRARARRDLEASPSHACGACLMDAVFCGHGSRGGVWGPFVQFQLPVWPSELVDMHDRAVCDDLLRGRRYPRRPVVR